MSWKDVYATEKMLINGQYREIEGHLYKRLFLCGEACDCCDRPVAINRAFFGRFIQYIRHVVRKLVWITTSVGS